MPALNTAWIQPQAAAVWPCASRPSGPSTWNGAMTMQRTRQPRSSITQSQVRDFTSCQPSRSSTTKLLAASLRAMAGTRRAARKAALTRKVAPSTAMAPPAPSCRSAVDRRQDGQLPYLRHAAEQQDCSADLHCRADEVAGDHQRGPRQAVGPHAAHQSERRQREALRGEHQAEIRGGAGEAEHGEGERDRRDAVPEHRDALRQKDVAEGADPEKAEAPGGNGGCAGRRTHCLS